jgi:hypothetical protein
MAASSTGGIMKRKPKMKSPDGSGAFRMTENHGLQFSLNFTPAKERAGWTEVPAAKKDATVPESKVKR